MVWSFALLYIVDKPCLVAETVGETDARTAGNHTGVTDVDETIDEQTAGNLAAGICTAERLTRQDIDDFTENSTVCTPTCGSSTTSALPFFCATGSSPSGPGTMCAQDGVRSRDRTGTTMGMMQAGDTLPCSYQVNAYPWPTRYLRKGQHQTPFATFLAPAHVGFVPQLLEDRVPAACLVYPLQRRPG
jgi:hypothetical protein